MIIATGYGSQIVKELINLGGESNIKRMVADNIQGNEADRFLFCQGILQGVRIEENDASVNSWLGNFKNIAAACERILLRNRYARICIIGSESGIMGSYDMAYAGAKAAMHLYIETRRIQHHQQQLVGIAPSIISDAGMTLRRDDGPAMAERAADHPKGRFCTSAEVARLVRFLLYEDLGYINNTVIRMNGGEHAGK